MVKPGYQHPIDQKTLDATKDLFEKILKLLQPFTPFVAEEIWHLLRNREDDDDLIISQWPVVENKERKILDHFKTAEEVITNLRNIRIKNNIANKVKIDLFVKKNKDLDPKFDVVIKKMANLSQLEYCIEKIDNSNSFIVNSNEYFVPFGEMIDVEAERQKVEEELLYTKGFLQSVQRKLQNESFISGAPDKVVEIERRKEADALSKIALLEEKLSGLN